MNLPRNSKSWKLKFNHQSRLSWISKRVLRKSITIKSQLLTGPGGGEGNKSHGFHGGREKGGGGIKKLTANERGENRKNITAP